jgi:sporulation protein YlmC with PRC-barrel domain
MTFHKPRFLKSLLRSTRENNIKEMSINNNMSEGKGMELPITDLIGKTVRNAKGIIIGKISESITDAISGEITSILIKPSQEMNLNGFTLSDSGDIIFPLSSLSCVKDIIIIEEALK